VSTKQIAEVSPRLKARIAGFCYVLIFIAAPSGAASATPTKMLITLACDTAVALLFYDLLKPVSRRLSLVAAVFRSPGPFKKPALPVGVQQGVSRCAGIFCFPCFADRLSHFQVGILA
jgi:hypothetical protein